MARANLLHLFNGNHIIGLDIGASSVKMAQFLKKEDGLYLIKIDLKEIKKTADDTLREKEILSLLKTLLAGIDTKRSKIIVNINCPKTALRRVQTPFMPKSELQRAITLEAKNFFSFHRDSALLDFEIVSEIVENGVRKYETLVATSPKETIDKYLSLLTKAGIKPASFVPSAYAFQKLAEYSFISTQSDEEETRCFVDIDEFYTELMIFKGKSLVFNRKIPAAGRDFTKSLTGVLVSDTGRVELSLSEAEKIKREIGIPAEGESRIIDGKISTIQILSMLRVPLEQLASEIERCFDYYLEETGGRKIDSLILFGGSAALKGLSKFLSEKLGVEVKLGNPMEGLKVKNGAVRDADKILLRLETAIGAALSEGRGINLLPPEIKEETKRVIRRGSVEVVATAFIILSILVYIGMKMQLSNFEKRASTAKLELSSLQPQLAKAEAYHAASRVLVDEPHWEEVFRELSHLIPDDIYLTRLGMADSIIKLKGIVTSEDGEHILSNFMLTLENGIFNNVKLVKTEDLKDAPGNEFELECWVD